MAVKKTKLTSVQTNNTGTTRHCYNNQEKPQAVPCRGPIRIETNKYEMFQN